MRFPRPTTPPRRRRFPARGERGRRRTTRSRRRQRSDDTVIEKQTTGRTTHDLVTALDAAGVPCAPFSRTPARREGAGPVLGAGTREALLGAGFTAGDVDALVASGAAQEAET